MNNKSWALTPLALALSTSIHANDDVEIHDTVTVTATRSEQSLMDVPLSVSVLTEDDIKKKTSSSLAEILRDVPGVQVQDTQGAKRISIRGESAHRVLVIIDGQKVSEQKSMSGVPLLIDPGQIARIEVIKGPASVLYGSEAIGGVINIISKGASDRPIQLDITSRFSSAANEFYNSATISGAKDGFEYRISGSLTDADDVRIGGGGTNLNSYYEQENVSLFAAYNIDKLRFGVNYDRFNQDFGDLTPYVDTSFSMYQSLPEWSRDKVALFAEYSPADQVLKKVRVDLSHQNTFKDFRLNMNMAMGSLTMVSDSITENSLEDNAISIQTDWQFFGNHNVIAGAEYLTSKVKADSESTTTIDPMPSSSEFVTEKAQQDTFAVYAQDQIKFDNDWALTLGARYTQVENHDFSSTDTSQDDKDEVTYRNTVFSVGTVYRGFDNVSLRGSFSQGFRSASLMDIYLGSGSSFIPNPDLKPEKSDNFEVGARFDLASLVIDTSIYYNDATDYIETEELIEDTLYQKVNRDKAKTIGWESSLSYTMMNGLEPYANTTVSSRETTTDGFTTDKVGLPWLHGNAGLRFEDFVGNMDYQLSTYSRFAVRTEEESSTGEVTEYPGWATLNVSAGINGDFKQDNSWSLNLAVENLLDKKYAPAKENSMGYAAGINVSLIGSVSFR